MKRRAFLVPLAASVAALIGVASASSATNTAQRDIRSIIEAAKSQPAGPLFIERNQSVSMELAAHGSHHSHHSHGSHRSHVSAHS